LAASGGEQGFAVVHRTRRTRGEASVEDGALVWGATALVAFFLATLPMVAAHVAFLVQLQISRVFWLVDTVATIYALALVRRERTLRILAIVLTAFSLSRAVYVMTVERPERGVFALHLAESPWMDAMQWLSTEPLSTHVLADPGHSWKYGTSVRVAAGRDVFLEDVKDSAIAIYSRDVAARVVERTNAVTGLPLADRRPRPRALRQVRPELPGDRSGASAADRLRERSVPYLPTEGRRALNARTSCPASAGLEFTRALNARRGCPDSALF
jgi:hypothetical protein